MSNYAFLSNLVSFGPGVVLGLALALLIKRRMTQSFSGGLFTANLCGLDIADPVLKQRVAQALQERRRVESVPLAFRIAAAIWIALGVLFMLASAEKLLPQWVQSLTYGITCLGLSLLTLGAYLRIRNAQPVRVAMLTRRVPTDVIPMPWFAVAAFSACSTLLGITQANSGEFIAALFVCISALATTGVAWGMTGLPARLTGEDVEIERFIDERVRFNRAASILLLVFGQTFFYFVQAKFFPELSITSIVVLAVDFALYAGYVVWMLQRRKAPLVSNGVAA